MERENKKRLDYIWDFGIYIKKKKKSNPWVLCYPESKNFILYLLNI